MGPYKVDDEASPRIPGSSHPNCRCRRIPTEVEADEKADSLKKALAAGIVSGIGKRDNKEENTEEDIQYTYTEGDKNGYTLSGMDRDSMPDFFIQKRGHLLSPRYTINSPQKS